MESDMSEIKQMNWQKQRITELEAALDREKLHAAQWARRNEELEAKLDAAKLACAEAAEAALQAAPDYEAMHAMVRTAIMQAGNADLSHGAVSGSQQHNAPTSAPLAPRKG